MKCKFPLVALLLCALCLASCAPDQPPENSEQSDPQVTTPQSTTVTYPTVIPPDLKPGVQSGIGQTTEQIRYAEGEHTVLNVTLTLPVANVEGNATLQATLAAKLDATHRAIRQEIEDLYRQYLADYKAGREVLTTPSVQVRFALHYFSAEAASMTYILTETTGDGIVYSHSYHSNLDLRVGSSIHLSSLLAEGKTEGLLALLTQTLQDDPPEGLYPGAADQLDALLENAWYISEGRLTVLFEAGKIAPLSSGDISLSFTEDRLGELLSDYGKALL